MADAKQDEREALAETMHDAVCDCVGGFQGHDGGQRSEWRDQADAVLAAGFRRSGEVGETVLEWGVEYGANGVEPEPRGEASARRWLGMTRYPGARLMSRQRTTYPDRVTEWTEHAEDTTGGMG